MSISCAMVQPILQTMYNHRSEMVPCFIGDPGIGKTQGLYEFAEEKGVNVVTFILSNTVPSEVSGIRMPDKESKRMEVFDDMRMASLQDGDILFLDEILEAPPMLWSACLTLIQDRIMASGRKLPDVMIVAASNKVASPTIIPASVRNRFQFIQLEFDAFHWRKWFIKKHGVDPKTLVKCIEGDSDQYNIFTPREAEKLYTWLEDKQDLDTKKQVITHMFDANITKLLIDLVCKVKSPQQQIKEALDNSNIIIDTKGFEDMSLKEIMNVLSSLSCWEDIQFILATVEFEEQEQEEVEF